MTRRHRAAQWATKRRLGALALTATLTVGGPDLSRDSWLSVPSAFAYCRTAACEGDLVGARCLPAQSTDCGIELFWPTRCVGYSVQRDASDQIDLDLARTLVSKAFAAWETATCEGGPPSIEAEDMGPVTCDQVEYDPEKKNANLVVFRDESWPYDGAPLALTTVTYVLDTGEIRDADIEINSSEISGKPIILTTGETNVDVDLLSILTHEVGHFLGLFHSPEAAATMTTDYPRNSITLRTLDADDAAGICAAYPASTDVACNPIPKNGLGDSCAEPRDPPSKEEVSECSIRAHRARTSGRLWLFGAVAAFGLLRRLARNHAFRKQR